MSGCTYTTQGKIVCSKSIIKAEFQPTLESFVDTRPNQKDSTCTMINKKLNDVMSAYNCSARIDNKPPKCSFQFDCEET